MPVLPLRPSLSQIRKQAKSLQKSCASGDSEALKRLREHYPGYADCEADPRVEVSLRDTQLAIAREYGYESWSALKDKVESEAEKEDHTTIHARRIREQTSADDEIERIIRAATGSSIAERERFAHHFSSETYKVLRCASEVGVIGFRLYV